MRTAFIETLCELAKDDPRIFLLNGDLGYSVLERFREAFPKRYLNVGVAEQNLTGIAAGLSRTGKTVFTYSIANFPTLRCLEQIRNDVCYHEANVKIVAVGGGFTYASQGYTHHGVEELAILRTLPGMVVVAPGDPIETAQITRAITAHHGPCYLRLGKAGEPRVHCGPLQLELGKAIIVRPGVDAALITTGGMLKTAVDTAEMLAGENISLRVISMPTLKPLDVAVIKEAAAQMRVLVTLEEHSITGGLGSAVAEVLAELPPNQKRPAFERMGVPDRLYHEIGDQNFMRQLIGDPAATIRRLLAAH